MELGRFLFELPERRHQAPGHGGAVELAPGDPPQPSARVFASAKRTQTLKCGDKNILGQVIRQIEVMQRAGKITANGQPVAPDYSQK